MECKSSISNGRSCSFGSSFSQRFLGTGTGVHLFGALETSLMESSLGSNADVFLPLSFQIT